MKLHEHCKPKGRLVLTVLNGIKKFREFGPDDVVSGRFDPYTQRETYPMEVETDEGTKKFECHERGFVPSELRAEGFRKL